MRLLVSIISHNQGNLAYFLLNDLQKFCPSGEMEVILTLNTREEVPFKSTDFDFNFKILQNERPKGFGANHNAAFKWCPSDFFCIINPDVKLTEDPFTLLKNTASSGKIGVVTPLIKNNENQIEDNARRLPTPFRLLKRYWPMEKEAKFEYKIGNTPISPDWVAGIFMFFPSQAFAEMKGFDERYFLYFEDVDLCCRLRLAGYNIILDPRVSVVHDARRDSHKNRRYFKWHIQSAVRFFCSRVFWSSRFMHDRG